MNKKLMTEFENNTGEKPIYRDKDGCDCHTLKYVEWLEGNLGNAQTRYDYELLNMNDSNPKYTRTTY